MSPGRTVLSALHPARPRPGAPRCASNRPARGMSGFWTRQVHDEVVEDLGESEDELDESEEDLDE